MSQVIRIPQSLYSRLESHATGFDTPANVIERILQFYEESHGQVSVTGSVSTHSEIAPASRLEIVYVPANADTFKNQLLQTKQALIELYKTDGSKETKTWHAEKLTPKSDINANLRSGYLRGWREKGIEKAIIKIPDE